MDSTGPEAYIPDDPEACIPDKTQKQVALACDHPTQHVSESETPDSPTNKGAILGLRPATFVLSVLLVVVVVTAAISGSVGGTLAVKKAREYDFSMIRLTIDETSNRLMINDQVCLVLHHRKFIRSANTTHRDTRPSLFQHRRQIRND
ncbi:uncharacterized protein BDZ83DRAFT_654117 [Colletotrichum acutatum]|uniref:Uncharacterized protein n=1 Tax=Glomerella acutata TaxID=27357 RepID=A0AAD8XG34_GLOAC|nr:uncharacterized protein BDZ83DRAFT_654117 [Colletotrichum acutatum]KAK1721449.1 hypothetical protein BDZ83DRAFT_654117 [Colletotrichum acutatum]